MPISQSFANIAKTTMEQLQNLPGFGPVKVRNIDNAFHKPIRNNATDTLSRQQDPGSFIQQEVVSAQTRAAQLERETSPSWDIEVDENISEL